MVTKEDPSQVMQSLRLLRLARTVKLMRYSKDTFLIINSPWEKGATNHEGIGQDRPGAEQSSARQNMAA